MATQVLVSLSAHGGAGFAGRSPAGAHGAAADDLGLRPGHGLAASTAGSGMADVAGLLPHVDALLQISHTTIYTEVLYEVSTLLEGGGGGSVPEGSEVLLLGETKRNRSL